MVRPRPQELSLGVIYNCRYRDGSISSGRNPPLLTAVVYRYLFDPVWNIVICRTWPKLILRLPFLKTLIPRLGPVLVTVQHPRVSLLCICLTPLTDRPKAAKKRPRLFPLGQMVKFLPFLGPTHNVYCLPLLPINRIPLKLTLWSRAMVLEVLNEDRLLTD